MFWWPGAESTCARIRVWQEWLVLTIFYQAQRKSSIEAIEPHHVRGYLDK
jgi:hypothetical protein